MSKCDGKDSRSVGGASQVRILKGYAGAAWALPRDCNDVAGFRSALYPMRNIRGVGRSRGLLPHFAWRNLHSLQGNDGWQRQFHHWTCFRLHLEHDKGGDEDGHSKRALVEGSLIVRLHASALELQISRRNFRPSSGAACRLRPAM